MLWFMVVILYEYLCINKEWLDFLPNNLKIHNKIYNADLCI